MLWFAKTKEAAGLKLSASFMKSFTMHPPTIIPPGQRNFCTLESQYVHLSHLKAKINVAIQDSFGREPGDVE